MHIIIKVIKIITVDSKLIFKTMYIYVKRRMNANAIKNGKISSVSIKACKYLSYPYMFLTKPRLNNNCTA